MFKQPPRHKTEEFINSNNNINSAFYFQYTSICKNDVDKLELWYEELLSKIRPNAVGLVDAFDLHDEVSY